MIIGKDIQIHTLLITLTSTPPPNLSLLSSDNKWSSIGFSLNTPSSLLESIRKDMLLDKINMVQALHKILEEWTGRAASNARLDVLIAVFRDNALNSYAEALVAKFGSSGGHAPRDMQDFEQQQRLIKSNLPALVKLTILNPGTIAILESRGCLSEDDVNALDAIPNVGEKNKHFYKIVQTRPGMFEVLIEAMVETNQTGALNILSSG